jgi:hypothetical protein
VFSPFQPQHKWLIGIEFIFVVRNLFFYLIDAFRLHNKLLPNSAQTFLRLVQLLEEWRVWCKFSNEPYDIVIRQYYGQSFRAMTSVLQPFHLLVIALSGWLNRQQLAVTDYLIEENRVLKEQLEARNKLGNRLIEEVITHVA